MDLLTDGISKYGGVDVLASSRRLAWKGLVADLRHHRASELPPFEPKALEICIAVACHDECVVTRRGQGIWQRTRVEPGIAWLCPAGVLEEDIQISRWHDILHLHLPADCFAHHADGGGAQARQGSIRYLAGVHDELIRRAGWEVMAEMQAPTSSAHVRIQSLAHMLTARIAHRYASTVPRVGPVPRQYRLDELRLRRVLEYMAQHIEDDISLDDLAKAACLSAFHFHRMFMKRMGMPPHRYLSELRLERAKTLLALGKVSLAEISSSCCFSSQSNFSRAFRRATGASPMQYRREAR